MPPEDDPLTFYGRNIIRDYHARLRATAGLDQSDCVDAFDDEFSFVHGEKVGILGAGIGGLYAALILDSLDIEYKILETTDRTGGRMFTYKFLGGEKYDYYDAGAMRFPFPKKDDEGQYKNGVMKRLADLTEYGPLNEGQHHLRDSLAQFYPQAQEGSNPGFSYFNGIREPMSNGPRGPFGAQELGVDPDYIRVGVDAIIGDVTEPFVRMLVQDIQTGGRKGWEVLKANEPYSVWAYMATKYLPSAHLKLSPQHLPVNVINWCALLGGGAINGALTETVVAMLTTAKIDNIDYGDIQWKCFEGGSETLPKRIEEYLKKRGTCIQFNKRVTAISEHHTVSRIPASFSCSEVLTNKKELSDDTFKPILSEDNAIGERTETERRTGVPSVMVTVNGNEGHCYSHVISTLPLSVLRTVDLKGAGLTAAQINAIRTVQYDTTIKIAILFKSNWWTTKLGIVGGQTFTDLPICTIVYPSYGVNSSTPSKVLTAGYAWKTNAHCLGSLASRQDRGALKDFMLRSLAEVHSGLHPDVTYAYLDEQFVDMHVKDWNRDECSMGPYATFEPGQFQGFYSSLTYPAANKRLHFAGEAVSTHHGWVVGALDSSWRAIYEYLKVTKQHQKIEKFKRTWGENSEWAVESPFVQCAKEEPRIDLLDEHLRLVEYATRNNVIR